MPHGAISYSLFGYNRESYKDCFDFKHYLRGLHFNIRVAPLIYPHYKVFVNLDEETYESPYKQLFEEHKDRGHLDFRVHSRGELCRNMLWRLFPVWDNYDRVLCRDTDSLISPREAKCVRYWEANGRIAHSITDSISHNVVLMGGMIGFASKEFKETIKCETFNNMMSMARGYDFNKKGSDQDFLNREILPKIHQSLTEHHMLGLPNSFRSDWSNKVPDVDMGFPPGYDELNYICFHIGASGMREAALLKFLDEFGTDKEYFDKVEKKFDKLFYWKL